MNANAIGIGSDLGESTRSPRITLLGIALTAVSLLAAGCSLDFNEAVPCRTSDHCPSGFACNQAIGRCEPGEPGPDEDAGPDLADLDDDDLAGPDLVDETPLDDATDPDTGSPDLAPDTNDDVADVEGDTNGTPDCDELTCTCPDAEAMVLIVRDGLGAFCVDRHEASRPDATAADPGLDETQASARPDVLPWAGAAQAAARLACTNAGKRLCAASEWMHACGGPDLWLYPYDASSYQTTACNGADAGTGAVAATGSFVDCISPELPVDMSGNLAEWVDEGTAHGGSFEDGSEALRCLGAGQEPNALDPGDTVGFRCCADPVPL